MKKYTSITRGTILEFMNYRFSFIANLLLNIIYIMLSFYLWQAIYKSSGDASIKGMTFRDTFTYIAMAFMTNSLFKTQVDWKISSSIMNGNIITYLLRPIKYEMYTFFDSLGSFILNFITIFIPSMLTMLIFNSFRLTFNINILFYIISLFLSYLISYNIDFAIGIFAFYTESLGGIMTIKNVIVSLLGGVLFPIAFLPDMVVELIRFTPFYSMYNTPISIINDTTLGIFNYIHLILFQAFWWVALTLFNKIFFKISIKKITINGG